MRMKTLSFLLVIVIVHSALCQCEPACDVDFPTCCAYPESTDYHCVDMTTDTSNCGGCNVECPSGAECTDSACECGFTVCGTAPGECVDTSTDTYNCGGCGIECPPGADCVESICTCGGYTLCGVAPYNTCADLDTDYYHCGSCENSCYGPQVCVTGTCIGSCPPETPDVCGTECVNKNEDYYNCGTCGKECPAGSSCVLGVCECTSGTMCGAPGEEECVDTHENTKHCGGCDTACAVEGICTAGVCGCETWHPDVCNNTCTDVLLDDNNCGTCGNVCEPFSNCIGGKCVCWDTCGGTTCIDSNEWSNTMYCGSCYVKCPVGYECTQVSNEWQCASPGTAGCYVWGDPHMVTFDGLSYDFFGDGDYVLIESDKLRVDGRFSIVFPWYTFTIGTQFTVVLKLPEGSRKFEFHNGYTEAVLPYYSVDCMSQGRLPYLDSLHNVTVSYEYGTFVLNWGKGVMFKVYFSDAVGNLEAYLDEPYHSNVVGLCGNFDGIKYNDILYQSGGSVPVDYDTWDDQQLPMWQAGMSWNITFSNVWDQTFCLPYTIPYARDYSSPPTIPEFTTEVIAKAEQLCTALFVNATEDCLYLYDQCIFDLCISGVSAAAGTAIKAQIYRCERMLDPSSQCPNRCSGFGDCEPDALTGEYKCVCYDGYVGETCAPTCAHVDNCNGNGVCVDIDTCACNDVSFNPYDCSPLSMNCSTTYGAGCKFCDDYECLVCNNPTYLWNIDKTECVTTCGDGEWADRSTPDNHMCRYGGTCDAGAASTWPAGAQAVQGCTNQDPYLSSCTLECDTSLYEAASETRECTRTTPGPYPKSTLVCVALDTRCSQLPTVPTGYLLDETSCVFGADRKRVCETACDTEAQYSGTPVAVECTNDVWTAFQGCENTQAGGASALHLSLVTIALVVIVAILAL